LYPLNKWLFGLVTWFGRCGEKKNKDVFLQPGIESQFLVRSAHSLVAIVTAPPKIPNFDSRPKIHVILKAKQIYAV